MIDSGSLVSLVRRYLTFGHKLSSAPPGLLLVSAAGEPISILGQVTMSIQLELTTHLLSCNPMDRFYAKT